MNKRGILPSLGAGGSLTAAVLCAAAIVGGVLTFRGEPGGGAEGNTGDVTVADATRHARTRSARPAAQTVTIAKRTTTRTAPVPRRRTTRTTRATVRPHAAMPRATITPRATTPPPPAPAPAPQPSAPSPPVVPKPPATVQQVRQVTKPVVDAIPEPAHTQVQTVVDAVDQVTGVVDQTVDGLLP